MATSGEDQKADAVVAERQPAEPFMDLEATPATPDTAAGAPPMIKVVIEEVKSDAPDLQTQKLVPMSKHVTKAPKGIKWTKTTLKEPFASSFTELELTPGIIEPTLIVPVKTPGLQSQKTRRVVLPNGMKVLITSDPELPMSGAGLANLDGSWQNPVESMGLAHFIEHMLFMGTKQHPKPSSFDTYLSANGAPISNAETGSQVTQFAFSVDHKALPDALDRFADLFTDPLFTTSGLHKEIHAVYQEEQMHKDSDTWRQLFVQKVTANPEHPWSRFTIGTLKTLGGVDHAEIKKMYETHYSANLMASAVYTALPLDEAEVIVRDRLGRIPNRHLKAEHFTMPLLDPQRAGTAIWQRSVKTQHTLLMQWELPKELHSESIHGERHHLSKVRPDRLIGYVLNYLGEKSLFLQFQTAGLAHSVSAYQNDQGLDSSLFEISVSLTPDGFKKWETVVETIFQAIAALRKKGIPRHVFETLHTSDKNAIQWKWRDSDVFDKAMDTCGDILQTFHWGSYPFVDDVLQEYDAKPAMALLEVLKPETMHIYGLAPEFPQGTEHAEEHTEEYYKAKWKQVDFTEPQKARWSLALPAEFLEIPGANPYLPKHLAVTKNLQPKPVYPAIPTPELLRDEHAQKLLLWEDKVFGDPYVMGTVTMKTDKGLASNDALINLSILLSCVNHAILPKMTPFDEASISWTLGAGSGTNLEITFAATNTEPAHYTALLTQLARYARQIGDGKLHHFVDQKTFEMLQTSTLHTLENSNKASPINKAIAKTHELLLAKNYPVEEQIAAVKRATFDSVSKLGPKLFSKARFEGFFSGQITKETTLKTWDTLMQELNAKDIVALPEVDTLHEKMRVMNEQPVWATTSGPSTGYGAVLVVDGGGLDCKEREALSVLYEALPPAFYADLRSKQQTGYLVETESTVFVSHHDVLFYLVQSTLYKPGDLTRRFQTFIAHAVKDLMCGNSTVMDKKNFESIRGAKLAKFQHPNQNIGSVTSLMQTLLDNYDADWHAMEKKKKLIEDMSYDQVINVATKVLGASNKKRMAVGYVPDKASMDEFPEEFIAFDPKNDPKFEGKKQFKCVVSVPTLLKTTHRASKAGFKSGAPHHASLKNTGKGVVSVTASSESHSPEAVSKVSEEIQTAKQKHAWPSEEGNKK